MKNQGLLYFTDTHLTVIALLIFFAVFVAILFLQIKNYGKDQSEVFEKLPFEGEAHEFR